MVNIQIKLLRSSIFKYIKLHNSKVKYRQLVDTIIKINIFILFHLLAIRKLHKWQSYHIS